MNGVYFDKESARRITKAVRTVEQNERNIFPNLNVARPASQRKTKAARIIAKITGAGVAAGEFTAKEQVWDGSAFIDKTDARIWDSTDASLLLDIIPLNGGTFTTGDFVEVIPYHDSSDNQQWFVIDIAGAPVTTSTFPVQITSGGPGDSYTGDEYANGFDVAATTIGITIRIMQINSGVTVPAGTRGLAAKIGTDYWMAVPIILGTC